MFCFQSVKSDISDIIPNPIGLKKKYKEAQFTVFSFFGWTKKKSLTIIDLLVSLPPFFFYQDLTLIWLNQKQIYLLINQEENIVAYYFFF